VATFGLVFVIFAAMQLRPDGLALVVPAYIGAGFWFTSSTCFSNPALTVARSLTGTFTGIRVEDVPLFVVAQFVGAIAAMGFGAWLLAHSDERAPAKGDHIGQRPR
jgi:glycerol uptake facilitator-like aquaporin